MAKNEILVSNLYYQDIHRGSIKLDIIDSSFAPEFDIKLMMGEDEADITKLIPLQKYVFDITMVSVFEGMDKIYATLESDDGKINNKFSNNLRAAFNTDYTVDLDAERKGKLEVTFDFFPSLLGYAGKMSFYTTEERTILIEEFNLTVLPLETATLKVTSRRLIENPASLPTNLVYGDQIVILFNGTGATGLTTGTITNTPYQAQLGGLPLDEENPWIETVPTDTEMQLVVDAEGNIIGTVAGYVTKEEPLDPEQQLIEVVMGELRASAYIQAQETEVGYIAERYNQNLEWRAHILPDSGSATNLDWVISNFQGTSVNLGQIGDLAYYNIQRNVPTDSATVALLRPLNFEAIEQPYVGMACMFAWDSTKISNAKSREPFGNYQNSMAVKVSEKDVITWEEINSTELSPGEETIKDRNLVITILPDDVAELSAFVYDLETIRLNILGLDTQTRADEPYEGVANILFLKKTVRDDYAADVSYPRVVVADVVPLVIEDNLYSATYTKPEDLDIDLLDERYQVSSSFEFETPVSVFHYARKVIRNADNLEFTLGESNSSTPGNLHLVIWDLGPDTTLEIDNTPKAFGEVKPVANSEWSMTNLVPDLDVTSPDFHVIRTVGSSEAPIFMTGNLITRAADNVLTVQDFSNSQGEAYLGQSGLIAYNGSMDLDPISLGQMPFYQISLRVEADENNEVYIELADVANTKLDALLGEITDFTNYSVAIFATAESPLQSMSTKITETQIGLKFFFVNSTDPKWVNILIMRDKDNTIYRPNGNVPYPRVLGVAKGLMLAGQYFEIDLSYGLKIDGRLPRYQCIAQFQGYTNTNFSLAPNACLVRDENKWQIKPDGLVMDDLPISIAVIDYGPDVPEDNVNPIGPDPDPEGPTDPDDPGPPTGPTDPDDPGPPIP